MGRTGVTLLEVEEAAAQLQGRGKTPSVDNVREMLGTGSKSTIAQHLKNWKSKNGTAHGKLPSELLAIVTGLWERLNAETDARLNNSEIVYNKKIEGMQETLRRSQQASEELKADCHKFEENFFMERKIKEENIKLFQDETQERIKWQERCQENTKLIDSQKAENLRLHQLAGNIQANLEHYQSAVQQARTEQSLIIERNQQEFQKEKSELQNSLSIYREQAQLLQQEIEQKNTDFFELKNQFMLLQDNYNQRAIQLEENSRQLIILQERAEQIDKQNLSYKNEITHKDSIILKLEKETAVLDEIKNQLQNKLSNAEDKIEALRQDKSFLSQEKSELQNYIKQWKIIKE